MSGIGQIKSFTVIDALIPRTALDMVAGLSYIG